MSLTGFTKRDCKLFGSFATKYDFQNIFIELKLLLSKNKFVSNDDLKHVGPWNYRS